MLNQEKLKKLMENADGCSIGVDYLQINLKQAIPFLSEKLKCLDTDNSNIDFDNVGDYQISMIKQYSKRGPILNISISIEDIPYPIFQYMEYSQQQQKITKSEGKFVFYGTYFRLVEIRKLPLLFEEMFFGENYHYIRDEGISRVDYRIDLFYKKEKEIPNMEELIDARSNVKNRNHIMMEDQFIKYSGLLKNIEKVQKNQQVIYDIQSSFAKGDRLTGRDYGSKANKSLYFRMYDKLLDSVAKGKMMLYDDYFLYESVHRFEIEFRIKFNKKGTSDGIIRSYMFSELGELKEKIHKYLGLIDSDINQKFLYQYDKNEVTDFAEKSRYQRDFGGRGYQIAMGGFNPFISLHKNLTRKELNAELFNKIVFDYVCFISELGFINELGVRV